MWQIKIVTYRKFGWLFDTSYWHTSKFSRLLNKHLLEILSWNNLDSTCVLIGLLVSVFSWCYEARKWSKQCGLTVSELWEFTVRASYIVFLFVNNENNNFTKEIKYVVRASIACWKPRQSLWEFSALESLPNVRLDFHQAMKVPKTCFIS